MIVTVSSNGTISSHVSIYPPYLEAQRITHYPKGITVDAGVFVEDIKYYEVLDGVNPTLKPNWVALKAADIEAAKPSLEEVKAKRKAEVKSLFLEAAKNPTADTGLGYSVEANYSDLRDFEIGRDFALPNVIASDNTSHPVDDAGYVAIISAIKLNGLGLKQNKWVHDAAIEALTTVQEVVDYDITTGW